MTLQEIVNEIKLDITANVLELEVDDATITQYINQALRKMERYWDETTLITVPFSSCIDMSGFNSSAVVKVYRTEGTGISDGEVSVMNDPAYMQQWYVFSNGGTMYNLQDYVMNYASWATLSQIRNTLSTDMAFKEDKHNNKLYINNALTTPASITIEYIPKLQSVEDIQSDYWIDILIQLSLAYTKIGIGRIRTRFTSSNALWTQDGEKMLEEGTTEFKELDEKLRANSNLIYPID